MKLKDYDEVIREAVCVWELFRQFGYLSKEIYFAHEKGSKEGCTSVGITLVHNGRTASLRVGETSYDEKQTILNWEGIGNEWNTAPEKEKMEIFVNSYAFRNSAIIITNLVIQDFGVTPQQIEQQKLIFN